MQKRMPKLAWFVFIVIQALLGTCVGLFALSGQKPDVYPAGTSVHTAHDDIDIGKMNLQKSKEKLDDYFNFLIEQGKADISVGDKRFSVQYKDIDLKFDADKTLKAISSDLGKSALSQLITGEPGPRGYPPVITLNSGKLADFLEKNFKAYEKEPIPDTYGIQDGQLIYTPKTAGIKIDYAALTKKAAAHAVSLSQDALTIDTGDGEIFKAYTGEVTGTDQLFNTIVSTSSIPLGTVSQSDCLNLIGSFNSKVFEPGRLIKLSEMADLTGTHNDGWNDMINRTATAVYQAFMPIQGIKALARSQADIAQPYSEAGLEAVIKGEGGDLELENDTGYPLMILSEVRNGSISLYVVSTGDIPCGILIAQKKDVVPPPVIYNVNGEMKPGESNVVSEGSEGFTVDVSRVIGNDREELNSDRYEPVSRVVEIGGEPLNTGSK